MCLVKTALCWRCGHLFLGLELECWKIKIGDNNGCARQTRRGAARWLAAPYPCSSGCDSDHCGQTLTYLFCLQCIYECYRFCHCPIILQINKS